MPTSNRPDIEVLEARVKKIHEQICSYKGVRIYATTKRRLIELENVLNECSSVIHSICNDVPSKCIKEDSTALTYNPTKWIPWSIDVKYTSQDINLLKKRYPVKDIMRSFSIGIKDAAYMSADCGILEVSKFANLLDTWFNSRYFPKYNQPKFYVAGRIFEWINQLICCAGYHLHANTFDAFVEYTYDWLEEISTPKYLNNPANNFCTPEQVGDVIFKGQVIYTKEAVLFEKLIKRCIYNSKFYPEELHSIENDIVKCNIYTPSSLKIKVLLSEITNLTLAPFFDKNIYME